MAAETQAQARLREYETIFLLKPDLTDDNVDKVKERVRDIVGREGGKLLRFTIWGKKKTAYALAKAPRAIYVHTSYLGRSGLVAEVERNLRNYDEVSRFLSVKVADEIDPETRPVLEDVKMAGDVDEKPASPEKDPQAIFRGDADDVVAAGVDLEDVEEA
ncbi:MAG: 30S ribosomal protein S6 [Myxococcaceae bacterium]